MTSPRLNEALQFIRHTHKENIDLALILGSGLGDFADQIEGVKVPYGDIPGFSPSTAPNHAGLLHMGRLNGRPVLALQGRVHLYEGYSVQDVAFPVELLNALGANKIILTNVSGSVNPDYVAGDIIGIKDHIFLPGLSGQSPLAGRERTADRSNFLNLTYAYDKALLDLADESDIGALEHGVYACLAGPHFETPAEGRMLRSLGADMVGMSTVYETIMARHLDMRVLALSLIVNPVITEPDTQEDMTEDDIWDIVMTSRPRLEKLLHHVVKSI